MRVNKANVDLANILLQHRYIDFLVHEVDAHGNIVSLSQLDKPQGEPLAPLDAPAACEASAMVNSQPSLIITLT